MRTFQYGGGVVEGAVVRNGEDGLVEEDLLNM